MSVCKPNDASQFSIAQLLVLTTLLACLVSYALQSRWTYIPEYLLAFYEQGSVYRKAVIIFVSSLLPALVLAIVVWSVFRLPHLARGYRQLMQNRKTRQHAIRRELAAQRREHDHQSSEST